MELKLL